MMFLAINACSGLFNVFAGLVLGIHAKVNNKVCYGIVG